MGEIITTDQGSYVVSDPGIGSIQTQADILDLVALCRQPVANRVLILKGVLSPDFFDLSTGLAGDITLKLSTYRVKTAIIVDLESISSQRFHEWVYECNRGQEIHFCSTREQAEEWLLHPIKPHSSS